MHLKNYTSVYLKAFYLEYLDNEKVAFLLVAYLHRKAIKVIQKSQSIGISTKAECGGVADVQGWG